VLLCPVPFLVPTITLGRRPNRLLRIPVYSTVVFGDVWAPSSGADSWEFASGVVTDAGTNLTISFGDRACGSTMKSPIVKWGVISSNCSKVTMHDTQPNCPRQGTCFYRRTAAPPPPPSPCPVDPKTPVDVGWLRCRTKAVIEGCREKIQPNSPLNKLGVNATWAFVPIQFWQLRTYNL
jgi:hypothetical protein